MSSEDENELEFKEFLKYKSQLTKPKPEKIKIEEEDKNIEIVEDKPIKKKKVLSEKQKAILKSAREKRTHNIEKQRLEKKLEASKLLLNIKDEKEEKQIKNKINKMPIIEESSESSEPEQIIIKKKKKKKPKKIIIEESESESEEEEEEIPKKRNVKSKQVTKIGPHKITNENVNNKAIFF